MFDSCEKFLEILCNNLLSRNNPILVSTTRGEKMFRKTYARDIPGSDRPKWEEIILTDQEEREQEEVARQENLYLLRQCIADARNVIKDEELKDFQGHVIGLATTLFKKRASHAVFFKESKCREIFEGFIQNGLVAGVV